MMIKKKFNNQGFVLLETVIVSVFIISIFTFIYISIVPLLGKYEELAYEYDFDIAYKLYHVRDAMYKDSNYKEMIKEKYSVIDSSKFNDDEYFYALENALFSGNSHTIVYIRKI